MAAFVGSGQSQLMKYLYPEDGWQVFVMENHPFMNMIDKEDTESASTANTSGIVHSFNWANPQAVSQDLSVSLNYQNSLLHGQQVIVQLANFYAAIALNSKDLRASQNNKAAFMSAKKVNFDQALRELGQRIDVQLHGTGNGIIGTIQAAGTADGLLANQIQLTPLVSAQQFQYGMLLQCVSNFPLDGSQPTIVAGPAKVVGVNQAFTNGAFQIILTLDNASGFSDGDYIVNAGGALGYSSTNPEGALIGQGAWNPLTAPAPGSTFLGLPTSQDVFRLRGGRLVAQGSSVREAIQEADTMINAMGERADLVQLNPTDWRTLNTELQNFVRYEDVERAGIAFKVMVLNGAGGNDLKVMSDPNQPQGIVRVSKLDAWKLLHMGPLTQLVDEDGLSMRLLPGADAYQLRFRSWCQLVNDRPNSSCVIQLT